MLKKYFTLLLFISLLYPGLSQNQSDKEGIAAVVFMDSLVVTAKKKGFDVQEFIQLVIEDRSFYTAFHNLRFLNFQFNSEMRFYNKKGKEKASYSAQLMQHSDGQCRTMDIVNEQIKGNFFKGKKRKHRYYTARMFDNVFYTHGKACSSRDESIIDNHAKGIRKHINELKKLMFQPGQKVNVPLIGNKTAIFSKKMRPFYDYKIESKKYNQDKDCYVFTAKVKDQYQERKEGKTIIKYMETYFDKKTFQVVARDYHLKYKGALFSFDVQMEVELKNIGNQFVPEKINYKGSWNIPTKKREIGEFQVDFFDFFQKNKAEVKN